MRKKKISEELRLRIKLEWKVLKKWGI